MKDDYYLADCVYDHAKKCDLYTEMKREMEREIREGLEKEIRFHQFKFMKLLAKTAKHEMKKACEKRDYLTKQGADGALIQWARGEAYAYSKVYSDFRGTLNTLAAEWGDAIKEGLGKYEGEEE